jgi:peptidyl-tRNA hydrolase, PTH1 family
MKVFVGLGNFEDKYTGTRHNVGKDFLIWFAQKNHFSDFEFDKYSNAKISKGNWKGEDVEIVLPETYMNLSGESVVKYLQSKSSLDDTRDRQISNLKPQNDLYVFHDDIDMNFGDVKIKEVESGSGGHNGIESIFQHLGRKNFKRVKFGIIPKRLFIGFKKPSRDKVSDFVLSKFSSAERDLLDDVYKKVESLI